tara:strand:+ start:603 stop:1859 length:1257 start_codon:yes stop_codon:yes gene_type:complete
MLLYIIYLLLSPFFWLILLLSSLFNYKVRHNFFHSKSTIKLAEKKRIKTSKTVLLFHAASAGEFEQLKPILAEIDRTKYFIIQSFTSPTIYSKEKNNNIIDVVCYQPFDLIWLSYIYFKAINPHKYIITRHDIWPTHLFITHNMKIDTYLINGNIHKNSIWMKPLLKSLSSKIFNFFNLIVVPSESIKKNIETFNLYNKVEVLQDSRFQQIINRYKKNNDLELLPISFLDSKNLIFGSIDQEDEKNIFEALKIIYPDGDKALKKHNIKLIIVPHEINNKKLKEMANWLILNNFNYTFYSAIKNHNINISNVLIVDIVGILADLYKYSSVAYIGGGFSRGVHSVIEPAVYNNFIGFGPNIEMLDEAKELINKKLANKVNNISELCDFMNLIKNKNQKSDTKSFIFKSNNINDFIKLILQ